jgi:hypothetical protein
VAEPYHAELAIAVNRRPVHIPLYDLFLHQAHTVVKLITDQSQGADDTVVFLGIRVSSVSPSLGKGLIEPALL